MSRGSVRAWLRPGLLGLHVAAIAAVVFCVLMGLWQLGVYDTRQADERADRQDVPRVALSSVWGPDQPFASRLDRRPVTITGRFAPVDQQVWVGGKRQDGRAGVWLVAPVLTADDQALLVVRGWSSKVAALPAVPSGQVEVDGVLQPGEAGGEAYDPDTREIGSVRIPALTNELPYDLYSGYAISTSRSAAGGLELATVPSGGVSWTVGLRNLAYAVQWWAFGLFAAFMWWRIGTDAVAASRPPVA